MDQRPDADQESTGVSQYHGTMAGTTGTIGSIITGEDIKYDGGTRKDELRVARMWTIARATSKVRSSAVVVAG